MAFCACPFLRWPREARPLKDDLPQRGHAGAVALRGWAPQGDRDGFSEIAFTRERLQDHCNNKRRRKDQRMPRQTIARLLAIALSALCASQPASAQDSVASFYKGRTVTIVAASSPGGGYDLYARLIA